MLYEVEWTKRGAPFLETGLDEIGARRRFRQLNRDWTVEKIAVRDETGKVVAFMDWDIGE